jgi:D-cysteine desulfhydrase
VDAAGLRDRAEAVADELTATGRPYLIPFGGSDPRAALGYVRCGEEILRALPRVRHVVTALGSGATMAGLVGCLGPERVLGVDVGALPDPAPTVADLVERLDGARPGALRVRREQVGPGYSQLTSSVRAALTLAARTEGLLLDPVYTGRALAGLVAAVGEGDVRPGETVVLLHSGGLPGFFGHADAVAFALAAAAPPPG